MIDKKKFFYILNRQCARSQKLQYDLGIFLSLDKIFHHFKKIVW